MHCMPDRTRATHLYGGLYAALAFIVRLTLDKHSVHVWYLDASALVKLVVDESDSASVREFYNSNSNLHATSLCVTEALGVIKAKWAHRHITQDDYFKATRCLIINSWGGKIGLDNIDLFTPEGLTAVEALARKHSLDLSDALQLETMLHGKFRYFADDARPILITADRKLAEAARHEDIRAWDCVTEEVPIEV